MFGAILYLTGSLMVIFATSVEMLLVSFGVFQGSLVKKVFFFLHKTYETKSNFMKIGFGIGLMVPVGYTNFNKYFIKKRVFMMSATQALKGLLIMLHPMIVNFAMNRYGFRGAMAIIAAINAHGLLGMIVQHPIEWHYKVIEVPEHELEPCKLDQSENDYFSKM